MGLIAFVGLLANLGSALLLKKDALTNINIKSAYLHLISDTVTSVAVILGAIIIQFLHIYYVDAILTFLIGGYVLFSSYKILREALSILMQSAPEHIDILELKERIEKIPEVNNIHHVHLWRLSDQDVLFEGHVDLERNYTVAETDIIRSNIEKILRSQYNIDHVTIQIEFGCCPEKDVIKKI
jgi:cobalt-zinc-cadmium efflux system protein